MPKSQTLNIVIILNNIRSSQNVGSIFRTCDAAGVSKILLVGFTPTPVDRFGRENKGLTKVSLGAEKSVLWEKVDNLKNAIKYVQNSLSVPASDCLASLTEASTRNFLAKKYPWNQKQVPKKNFEHKVDSNFLFVAIEQNKKAIDYREFKNSKLLASSSKLVLVFGNEVDGLSIDDLKLCDLIAEIPMRSQMVRQAHHPHKTKLGKESLNVSVCVGIVLYSLK